MIKFKPKLSHTLLLATLTVADVARVLYQPVGANTTSCEGGREACQRSAEMPMVEQL